MILLPALILDFWLAKQVRVMILPFIFLCFNSINVPMTSNNVKNNINIGLVLFPISYHFVSLLFS